MTRRIPSPLVLALLAACVGGALLTTGCSDDDPAAPAPLEGGYGLLRDGAGFDFATGDEVAADSAGVDLTLRLYGSGSCSADSCTITTILELETPTGGRLVDLGPVAREAVERPPVAGYRPGVALSHSTTFARADAPVELAWFADQLRNHTLVVVNDAGEAYKLTVLDALVLRGVWSPEAAYVEFAWERF